jgi:hypothetical protein
MRLLGRRRSSDGRRLVSEVFVGMLLVVFFFLLNIFSRVELLLVIFLCVLELSLLIRILLIRRLANPLFFFAGRVWLFFLVIFAFSIFMLFGRGLLFPFLALLFILLFGIDILFAAVLLHGLVSLVILHLLDRSYLLTAVLLLGVVLFLALTLRVLLNFKLVFPAMSRLFMSALFGRFGAEEVHLSL